MAVRKPRRKCRVMRLRVDSMPKGAVLRTRSAYAERSEAYQPDALRRVEVFGFGLQKAGFPLSPAPSLRSRSGGERDAMLLRVKGTGDTLGWIRWRPRSATHQTD